MGNYQSYRFDVGLEQDFDSNTFTAREGHAVVADMVGSLFDIEMKGAKKQAK